MAAFRAVLVLLVVICGCDRAPEEFLGTWRYDDTSTSTQQCELAADGELLQTGQFELVASASADLEMPTFGGRCSIKFFIEGNTAEARDEGCPVELSGSGCPTVSGTFSHSDFTLGLSSDAMHMGIEDHSSGTTGTNGCTADMCSFVVMGSATKVN